MALTQSEFTALLVLCTATSFTPGPNTTLSTALAANLGLRKALRFVLAVPCGWSLLFTLCAAGLGSLVLAVPALRLAIQALGVGYLLWLAARLARSGALGTVDAAALQVGFFQGMALQFVNIKAWMLGLTVVAGWIAGREDALQRYAVVLPVLVLYGLCSNLLYATMGSLLRHWLAGPLLDGTPSYRRLRNFNRAMALILVLTAGWMVSL